MKSFSTFFLILPACLFFGCGDENSTLSLEIKNGKNIFQAGAHIEVIPDGKSSDTLIFKIGGDVIGKNPTSKTTVLTIPRKTRLGKRSIDAFLADRDNPVASVKITVLAAEKPVLYTYRVLNEYPHDIEAYTQGLEFHNDTLYESTGQYGRSSLRKIDYQTGDVLKRINLDRKYFGEGLTVMNGKVYQLTWRENTGFIYEAGTLEKTGEFSYGASKEGWGLCNDGQKPYKSDGTERIWSLNPETFEEEGYIEVYTHSSRIESVNEMEWIDGRIYTNVYQRNAIAIINPQTGAVEGVIDLKNLKKRVKYHPRLDVLNGIAWKGGENCLFVTGKNWDKLFEIEYFEK